MAFGLEPRDGPLGKSTRNPKRRKKNSDLAFVPDVGFKSPFGARSDFKFKFWSKR